MKNIFFIVTFSSLFFSCEKAFIEGEPQEDVESVFETFWTIVDENYCFFEEKQVDWDNLYLLNKSKITKDQTPESVLKGIIEDMLQELKDGHVNLYTNEGRSRFDFTEGYPVNFDWDLLYDNYLRDNNTYAREGTFHSALIDSVIYLYISGFGDITVNGKTNLNPVTIADQFDELLNSFPSAKGLIIDVRDNSGGNTDNPDAILSRLITDRTLASYIRPKNGPNHQDFSKPTPQYIEPRAPFYDKQVALLTNRASYSATNYFAEIMKTIPENVIVLGGKTGGGGGTPINKDLPNGWIVRLSSTQLLSSTMQQIEEGIIPDHIIDMQQEDRDNNKDTILEAALALYR